MKEYDTRVEVQIGKRKVRDGEMERERRRVEGSGRSRQTEIMVCPVFLLFLLPFRAASSGVVFATAV